MPHLFSQKRDILGILRLYKPYILAGLIIFLLFLHIFILIFGEKSLMVLFDLREEKQILEKSVRFYQVQNAYLNKEILEIKGVK